MNAVSFQHRSLYLHQSSPEIRALHRGKGGREFILLVLVLLLQGLAISYHPSQSHSFIKTVAGTGCQASLRSLCPDTVVLPDGEPRSTAWCQPYCGARELWAVGAGVWHMGSRCVTAKELMQHGWVRQAWPSAWPAGMGYSQGIPHWQLLNWQNLILSKSGVWDARLSWKRPLLSSE